MTSAKLCTAVPWDQSLRLVGDPVDVVTGTQAFNETDFRLVGEHIPIEWERRSDSRRNQIDRGVGYGFRLSFDVELRFDLDGITFVTGRSENIEFPFLGADGDRLVRGGHELLRKGLYHYVVSPPGTGPCWEFRFEREGTARPSALFFPDNRHAPVRLSYEKGLLVAMQVSAARRVAFEYAGQHLTGAVLLESGNPTKQRLVRYQYDGRGQLVSVEDAYGGTVRYEYDKDHRLIRLTDRRGYSFLFSYDSDGRCIHTRGEDGVEDYRFEYKTAEQLTVVTRGDGAVKRYYYDGQNSLVQVVDACGGMTAYLKDDKGRVITEADPNGNESEILYDDRDQPYAKRDPLGYVRRLPDDPSPHPLMHRLPESPVQWEQGEWVGPVQAAPDDVPLGKWLPRWLVDAWGENPIKPLAGSSVISNIQGLPVREELQDGRKRRWAYDANGYFRWYTDFDGKTSRYEYTSWNHLQREIDPLGSIAEYGYTKSEKVASIVDPLGTRHDYGYDLKDRLTLVRRHGKIREQYRYDGADNLVEKLNSEGKPLLTFAFGPGNLMKQRVLASGDVQEFEHGKDGRIVSAKNRAGKVVFRYDALGRRIADERDGKGVHHQFRIDRLLQTTVLRRFRTKYVRIDKTTTIVVDPTGQTQRLRLIGPGLVERSCSNDVEELSAYDGQGRCLLKAAEGPSLGKGWARRFEYSGEGDLLRRDDTFRGTVQYQYDDSHRLAKTTFGDGGTQEYVYDRAGNLLKAPGLAASVQAGNRLLEANEHRFTYNERDHLASRQGRTGKTTHTYDSRDLLVGIEGPGLSYQAEHDSLGRRAKKTVNGQVWQYYWDTDRLAAEIFPDGRLRVYVYPDAASWIPILFLDYDSIDADTTSAKRYHVYTDHLGCPELLLDDAGRTVWRARIDPYGTAHIEVGHEFHQPLRWPGHYFDVETGLHENRFRSYSPELGRYLQSDPAGTAGDLNLYAYTSNPLRTVDLRGLAEICLKCAANKKEAEKEDGKDAEETKSPGKRPPHDDIPLQEQTPEQLQATCKFHADALADAQEPREAWRNKNTFAVGAVEDSEGQRRLAATNNGVDTNKKARIYMAENDIEDHTNDSPKLTRRTATEEDGTPKLDNKGKPSKETVDENGNVFDKKSRSDHHAEQRMEKVPDPDKGETLAAQSPSQSCCPDCQKTVDLSKIPPDRRRTGT
jgi:RHS repeat-associated protein